jgi:hypothetical protein
LKRPSRTSSGSRRGSKRSSSLNGLMERARKRITFAREKMHEAMASTVIEMIEEQQLEMGSRAFKEELVTRWRKQEDEILTSLIADVAEDHLNDQR